MGVSEGGYLSPAVSIQIPLVRCASLALNSETGPWEEFQLCNPERLDHFLTARNIFVPCFEAESVTRAR